MTKVIAIGGKKQSGKGSVSALLAGLTLTSYKIIPDFQVLPNCNLLVSGEEVDPNYFADHGIVKIYAFADAIKEIAVDILGVKPHQVYGTNKQKNTQTHLRWENMPGVISNESLWEDLLGAYNVRVEKLGKRQAGKLPLVYHEAGNMTGREVMQYLGSDLFRKMYRKSWTNALKNRIQKDSPIFAIIGDMRFDGELTCVKEMDGITVYLTREFSDEDGHISENGFSSLEPFDVIVNNDHGELPKLFEETVTKLNRLKALAPV